MNTNNRIKWILTGILTLSSLPFLYLISKIEVWEIEYVLFTVGNVAGYLGIVFFALEILLGNRKLVSFFTKDLVEVNKFHQILGIYGVTFVLIHPLLEMYSYGKNLLFLVAPDFSTENATYITYGRVAFILFFVIFATSVWFRNSIKYRKWLYLHYLTYPLLLISFAHLSKVGTYFNEYTYIRTYIYMIGNLVLISTLYRLFNYLNFGKIKYTVKEVKEYGGNIHTITISPTEKKVPYVPGQYYYLKMASMFGEEHPFSLMEYKGTGDIVFGIRSIGKFSRKLSRLKMDDTVYVEGPYGAFTKEGHNKEPKVIIAGGIGITPFYEMLKKYANDKTYLFYCNRNIDEAVNIIELQNILGPNYFNVLNKETTKGETIINARLDIDILKEHVPNKIFKKANFFVCGSPTFIKGITKMLKDNNIDRVYSEMFSL